MKKIISIFILLISIQSSCQVAQSYRANSQTIYDQAGKLGTSSSPISMVVCKSIKKVFVRFADVVMTYNIVSSKKVNGATVYSLYSPKGKSNHKLKIKLDSFSLSLSGQTIVCPIDDFSVIEDFSNLGFE